MSGFSNLNAMSLRDCPHDPPHTYNDKAACWKQRAESISHRNKVGKRAKEVFDTGEIPHLWAHQAQNAARNKQGNLYFAGNIIYSYGSHFPIARHVANKAGKTAVLLTTARHSVTTSGHVHCVAMAVSHLAVFHVAHVEESCGTPKHTANLKDYAARINAALLKAARAKGNKAWHHNQATETTAEAIKYARFFGLKYAGLFPPVPAIDSLALAEIKKREAKRVAAERKRVLAENAENIARWRNGESVRLPYGLPDMLRVVSRPASEVSIAYTEVETSRGVRFPASHAKRGLALVRAVRERGETWHTNGHTCHLGAYAITSIDPHGNVTAGCHHVAWSEIERIAPQLDALPASEPTPEA